MRILGSFDELSYILLNGRGSCLNMKMVRTALNCFTVIKCNHVLAMGNKMQHIANKMFTYNCTGGNK
jgi:hypothetical protein